MKLFVNKQRIKMFLANNPIMAEVYFSQYPNLLYDETTIPYISIYYYNPKPYNDETITIPYYITDFYQREYYYNDTSLKFNLRYEVDGVVSYVNNLTAGDHNLVIGTLNAGLHWYSIQVIDSEGRESRRIFNDILVVDRATYDITEDQTYTITDADLATYGINKNNSIVENDMVNTRVGLTSLFADIQSQGYRKLVLPVGIYRVNRCIPNGTVENKDCPICIPTNLTIDMNGSTFKMHPYDDREYGEVAHVTNLMVKMAGCHDSHLINGTLEGDFFERKNELIWEDGSNAISGGNGEHSATFKVAGGGFCSLDNMTIKQTTGYNCGAGPNGSKGKAQLGAWADNTSVENGIDIIKEGYVTSAIGTMDDSLIASHYIVASVWLATGGLKGLYWDINFHFYDKDQAYIETIKVYQFTRCRIPEGAKYFRVTFKGTSADMANLSIHHMDVARYFTYNNCHWIDNRTCANPSQAQFFTFLNCDFTRSGQSITACEIDLEDGWEQQQDIFVKGCTILENIGTADIIDNSGINHVYEDNTNMSFNIRYRVIGTTIRNNTNCDVSITVGWMTRNTVRVYNNTNITKVSLGCTQDDFWGSERTKIKIKDNTMTLTYTDRATGFYVLDNNDIIITGSTSNMHCTNCNITMSTGAAYIGSGILMENCTFSAGEGFDTARFSFNKVDADRQYIGCTYASPTSLNNHNAFNSGTWTNCIFNDTLDINPQKSNTMGDIQFNNCIFKDIVTINIKECPECYVQFNNCTFEASPIFLGYGEDNTEFNNCIIPN